MQKNILFTLLMMFCTSSWAEDGNPNTSPQATENIQTQGTYNLKFSAFVDMRFSSFSAKENPNVSSPHAESGFGVEDGAIYISYEKNRVALISDISFRHSKDSDSTPTAKAPSQSSNNNIVVGSDRSQLYLKYNASENAHVYLGQFDTIFGLEQNDSKDRFFSKGGLVYDYILPVTHTGVMLEYLSNELYSKIFSANPNNKGTYGTSAAGDENSEYGLVVGYANSQYRAQIGAMSRPILKADGNSRSNRILYDLTAGISFSSLSIDLEYASLDDPNKNTLTPLDSNDREKNGVGIFCLISHKLTNNFFAGLRIENIQNDPTGVSIKNIDSYGVSAHYALTPELELRSEYIGYKYKNQTDFAWEDSRANIAAIFKL